MNKRKIKTKRYYAKLTNGPIGDMTIRQLVRLGYSIKLVPISDSEFSSTRVILCKNDKVRSLLNIKDETVYEN